MYFDQVALVMHYNLHGLFTEILTYTNNRQLNRIRLIRKKQIKIFLLLVIGFKMYTRM